MPAVLAGNLIDPPFQRFAQGEIGAAECEDGPRQHRAEQPVRQGHHDRDHPPAAGLAQDFPAFDQAETAGRLDAALEASDASDLPPAIGAALSVGLAKERGIGTTVLMPYCDRLGYFGFWYRQLWAESLGKGGNGTTPVRAMGTVDQHSQLQLYLGGPADKMFTVLVLDTAGKGLR